MRIEDRVRAATRARADLVRDTRPLDLSCDRPATARRSARARQVRGWLIPFAAAAAVVALAVSLVEVRDAAGPRQGPPPAAPAAVLAHVPRYYAAVVPNRSAAPDSPTTAFTVVDDHTGKQVVDFEAPGGSTLEGVSAAADDRTFFVTFKDAVGESVNWSVWVIHLEQGRPYTVQGLQIEPMAGAADLEVWPSPDGREVAVLSDKVTGASTVTTLQVYRDSPTAQTSPRTLVPLRTWTAAERDAAVTGLSGSTVSWLSDSRRLAFDLPGLAPGAAGYVTEREMDTTAPSGDLVAASRALFVRPNAGQSACGELSVTPDGGTVICGTRVAAAAGPSGADCADQGPALVAYSLSTGKRVGVLAAYGQACAAGAAVPVWSDAAARDVIGLFSTSTGGSSRVLGVAVGGKLYSLPLPASPVQAGAIAF